MYKRQASDVYKRQAYALASLISEDELSDENVIANAFDPRVVEVESAAVAKAAIESGVARI